MPTAPAKPVRTADQRAALYLAIGLTVVRLAVLFRTPLDLYPDEAQYWLWSRTLEFGYYSKPPMIAWAIWATTAFGGDAEPWVRLSAPLFQCGATLAVFALGNRLYGARAGLVGAALYALMPGIQLSSAVIATDAPLLFFLGLTLLAYANLQGATGRARLSLAAALGACLGLAFLSKYAAVYTAGGLVLHALLSRDARRVWTPATLALAVGALAVVLAPNLAWNASHQFATFHHTLQNADWELGDLFHFGGLGEFLLTQFGVFGPIPFGALVAGVVLAARRRSLPAPDLMLLCMVLPAIAIVSVQAFLSRANANWSGAAYLPAAVLVGAWMVRWRTRRWLIAALAIQAAAAIAFLAFTLSPPLAERVGVANGFKRAKGWDQTTDLVLDRARAERDTGLTAIAVNNRFLYYALAYYGREFFRDPTNPPLKAWLLTEGPQNQAEASAPLTPAQGGRVLSVVYEGWWRAEMMGDFAKVSDREIDSLTLDRDNRRRLEIFVGEGFHPRPRDPLTGRPTPP